jgi:hypothetical protein
MWRRREVMRAHVLNLPPMRCESMPAVAAVSDLNLLEKGVESL